MTSEVFAIKVTKFPRTRLLEVRYSGVVPERFRRGDSVKELESALAEQEEESEITGADGAFPITLPPTSLHPTPLHPTPLHPTPLHISNVCDGVAEDQEASWTLKLAKLKSEVTNQIAALQRNLYLQEHHLAQAMPGVRGLVNAVQENSGQTAEVLSVHVGTSPSVQCYRQRGSVRCGGEGGRCRRKALPFSRFCLKHIHCDEDQVLYRGCIAIDGESLTQCLVPVYDILAEEPLCAKHKGITTLKALPKKRPAPSRPKPTKVPPTLPSVLPPKRRQPGKGRSEGGGKPLAGTLKQTPPKLLHPSHASLPSLTTLMGPTVIPSLSSSSWSSGESDGEDPAAATPKRPRLVTLPEHVPGKRVQLSPALPSLTHHPPPLSTLHLPPPQLEIGKIMMDSSSGEEEGDTT